MRSLSSHKLLIIIGPTASGKSRIATFLAHELKGEIISADSIQVYRGLDVGTAKPGQEIQSLVKHHMIDVAEPGSDFSLGDFVRMSEKIIEDIWKTERLPILAGGTGLYIRGLLKGIFEAPKRDDEYRESLHNLAAENGIAYLHELLAEIDPEAAKRITRHDAQRLMRALELYHKTNRTMSQLIKEGGFGQDRYASIKIGVNTNRSGLYKKIDERVDEFFKNGLVKEVKSLIESGVNPDCYSFKAVGYREVVSYLRGEIDHDTMIVLAKRNTRRYAKRQMTWFRKDQDIEWFIYKDDVSEKFREIYDHVLKKLQG